MGGDIWSTVLLFVLMGAVLYFLMIRPQQKRAKEQQNLMNGLAEGSRVMLISGILGTIKHLGEKQAVVEISPGVEMTVDKRAFSSQPVVDEFEYAADDDEVDADEPEGTEAATVEPTEPEATDADASEAGEPAESEPTWDNPGTSKN
ncbi:MAG: preprotein translocase subunit YajC [Actinobacteria bacterium]|nr:preprotein translocase subunit YajC [Actinomycetota bacterium]